MPMMKKKSRSRRRHDKEPSPAPPPTRPFQKSIPFDELPKEQCMFYTVLIGRVRQVMREGDCVTLILQDHRGKLHVKCTGEKQVEFVEQLTDSHVIKIHHALVNRVKAAAFCHNDTNSEFLLWEMRLGDVESPLALVRTSDESLEVLDKDVVEACHLTKWVQQREANKAKKKREEEERAKQRMEKVSQALSLDSPPRSQSTPLRQQQVEGSERVGGAKEVGVVTEPVLTVDGNHGNEQQIVAEYDDDIFSPSEDSDSGENISNVVNNNNNKDGGKHKQLVQDNTMSQLVQERSQLVQDNTMSQSVSLLVQDNTMSPMVQDSTKSQLARVRDDKVSHLFQERFQVVQHDTASRLVRERSQLVQDNTMSQLVQEMSQMVQDNTMSQSMSQLALEATMSTDEEDSTDHILEDMEQFLFDPRSQKPKVDQAAILREKYFEMRRQREEAEQRRSRESGQGEGFPSATANISDGQASSANEQEGDEEEERSREDIDTRECVPQGDEESGRQTRDSAHQGDEESGRQTRECVEQGDNDVPIEQHIVETVVKEEVREQVEETREEIVVVENSSQRKGVAISILKTVHQIVKEDIRDSVEERDEEEVRQQGENEGEVEEHVEERDEEEMREYVEERNEDAVREHMDQRNEEEMREHVKERNEDEVREHVEERNEDAVREHMDQRNEDEVREHVEERDEEEITDHVDDSIHEEHVEETTESGDTDMNTASADDTVRDNTDARVSRDIEKRESVPMEETQTDKSGEDAVTAGDAEKQTAMDREIEEEKEVDSLNSTTRGSTVDTIDEKPGTVVVMDRFKDFKEKFSNALANAHFRGMKEAAKLKLPLDSIISQRSPFSQCMDKVFEFNVGDTVHLMHWLDVDQSLMNPKWMEKCVVVDADCPQCGRCYPLATPLCPKCWAAFLPTQATAPTVLSKTMKEKRRIRFAREYANGAASDETSREVPSVNVATTRVLIPCRFETDVTSGRKGVRSIGLAVFAMPVSYFANLFPERPAFAKVLSYVQGPEWNTAASIPADLQLEVGYAARLYLVMHRFLVARGTLMAKRRLDSTVVVHVTDCRLKKIPLNEITVCGKPLQI